MKQTSIEWLIEQLKIVGYDYVIEQAFRMHKEEIVEAFEKGYDDYEVLKYDNFEEYYNETYGK